MSSVKAVLFDNDGVLAHTEETWFSANKTVLTDLGVPYTEEDFVLHTFIEGWGSLEWLRRNGLDEVLISKFVKERTRLWSELISQRNVTEPSAADVLAALKKCYLLGVVTNTQHDDFEKIHTDKSLINLFDVIVLREDYKNSKPEPDAYLAAMAKLNIPVEQILVVEDSPRGIRAAQSAGMKAVGIRNPAFRSLDISQADFQIENLVELPRLLNRISAS